MLIIIYSTIYYLFTKMIFEVIVMRRFFSILIVICIAFYMSACSSDEVLKEKKVVSEKNTETSAECAKGEADSHYPLTIATYSFQKENIDVTFKEKPKKVVAVYQNCIETLLALGVEDTIVGAAGLDHDVKDEYKDAFATINYYENGMTKEEVMALEPDLIVSWKSYFGEKKLGEVDFWHDRGINTYIMNNSGVRGDRKLEHEYTDILNLGKVFNKEEKAQQIVDEIKAEVAKGKAFAKGKDPVKALVLQCRKDGTFRNYGKDSVGGDLITKLGADLVVKESGNITAEKIALLNPDVIFTVYYSYYETSVERDDAISNLKDHKGLRSVNAIINDKVLPIRLGEVYCSGVRTMDGVKTMLKGLYPDEY